MKKPRNKKENEKQEEASTGRRPRGKKKREYMKKTKGRKKEGPSARRGSRGKKKSKYKKTSKVRRSSSARRSTCLLLTWDSAGWLSEPPEHLSAKDLPAACGFSIGSSRK